MDPKGNKGYQDLYLQADTALHAAKQSGRNRVVLFDKTDNAFDKDFESEDLQPGSSSG